MIVIQTRFRVISIGLIVFGLCAVTHGEFLRIAAYNTLNNPDNATEDASFTTVFEAMGNEMVGGRAKRLDILAVSETDAGSSARLVNVLNSLYGVSSYDAMVSSPDPFDRTAVVYDSSTVTLLDSTELTSGFTHHIMRAEFRPVATSGTADFYVYAIHLKSGATDSDKTTRAAEMALLRADADALGDGTNIIYAGDFNMSGSSEGAWSNLTASGNGQAFDTANAPGEWRDNPTFLDLHTQNSRSNMRHRLDFQFVSGELLDGIGLDYLAGSFHVFGNNGTHTLGDAIDTGTGASPVVLSALISASDHLPVVADYQIPIPTTRVWDSGPNGNGTDWFDPINWDPDGVPDPLDDLTVSFGNPTANGDISTFAAISISGSHITVTGTTTIQASGTLTIASGTLSTNAMDIAGFVTVGLSAAPSTEHNQVTVTANVTIDGTLNIALLNGFMPEYFDEFVILTAGSRSGEFDSVTGTLVNPDKILAPVYDHNGNIGLTLVAALPGDANFDGTVNGDDLLRWQANLFSGDEFVQGDFNLDGTVNGDDLLIWQSHLFDTVPQPAPATAPIPEPGTAVLFLGLGVLGMTTRRRAA